MSAEIRITVDDHAADEEGHESMSIALREEILSTDVEDVRFAPSGPAPDGTRGVDATAIIRDSKLSSSVLPGNQPVDVKRWTYNR